MPKDRGATPIEMALGLLAIVVPAALVILLVAPVFESRNFVRRAAAESARMGVLATDAPIAAADAVIADLAARSGVEMTSLSIIYCDGGPCSWERGAIFTVEIVMPVDEVSALLPVGGMTVRAKHSEQVDWYRSRP